MHKAGFVSIVGNPNVGKSTLMNLFVGERISIATFKAQTTRHRIMGIVSTDDYQIVFSDTPGVLKPNYKLQEDMLAFSVSSLEDADILLYVTDQLLCILPAPIVIRSTEHNGNICFPVIFISSDKTTARITCCPGFHAADPFCIPEQLIGR